MSRRSVSKNDAGGCGAILYKSGDSVVLVYASAYAGTNQATGASWAVGEDFDELLLQ